MSGHCERRWRVSTGAREASRARRVLPLAACRPAGSLVMLRRWRLRAGTRTQVLGRFDLRSL